jgi:hypothetical protein
MKIVLDLELTGGFTLPAIIAASIRYKETAHDGKP